MLYTRSVFNSSGPHRDQLLPLFYRWESSGSMMLSNLPKFPQVGSKNQVYLPRLGSFPYISVARSQWGTGQSPPSDSLHGRAKVREGRDHINMAGKNNLQEEMVKTETGGWPGENGPQARRGGFPGPHTHSKLRLVI